MVVHFHLRRIGRQASQSDLGDCANFIDLLKTVTIIGRSTDDSDYVIKSGSIKNNIIISRRHARIILGSNHGIRIHDDSLNGVFVNDIKIGGPTNLEEGDTVIFGHPTGANIPAGERVRQPESEYQYLFERCSCPAPGMYMQRRLPALQRAIEGPQQRHAIEGPQQRHAIEGPNSSQQIVQRQSVTASQTSRRGNQDQQFFHYESQVRISVPSAGNMDTIRTPDTRRTSPPSHRVAASGDNTPASVPGVRQVGPLYSPVSVATRRPITDVHNVPPAAHSCPALAIQVDLPQDLSRSAPRTPVPEDLSAAGHRWHDPTFPRPPYPSSAAPVIPVMEFRPDTEPEDSHDRAPEQYVKVTRSQSIIKTVVTDQSGTGHFEKSHIISQQETTVKSSSDQISSDDVLPNPSQVLFEEIMDTDAFDVDHQPAKTPNPDSPKTDPPHEIADPKPKSPKTADEGVLNPDHDVGEHAAIESVVEGGGSQVDNDVIVLEDDTLAVPNDTSAVLITGNSSVETPSVREGATTVTSEKEAVVVEETKDTPPELNLQEISAPDEKVKIAEMQEKDVESLGERNADVASCEDVVESGDTLTEMENPDPVDTDQTEAVLDADELSESESIDQGDRLVGSQSTLTGVDDSGNGVQPFNDDEKLGGSQSTVTGVVDGPEVSLEEAESATETGSQEKGEDNEARTETLSETSAMGKSNDGQGSVDGEDYEVRTETWSNIAADASNEDNIVAVEDCEARTETLTDAVAITTVEDNQVNVGGKDNGGNTETLPEPAAMVSNEGEDQGKVNIEDVTRTEALSETVALATNEEDEVRSQTETASLFTSDDDSREPTDAGSEMEADGLNLQDDRLKITNSEDHGDSPGHSPVELNSTVTEQTANEEDDAQGERSTSRRSSLQCEKENSHDCVYIYKESSEEIEEKETEFKAKHFDDAVDECEGEKESGKSKTEIIDGDAALPKHEDQPGDENLSSDDEEENSDDEVLAVPLPPSDTDSAPSSQTSKNQTAACSEIDKPNQSASASEDSNASVSQSLLLDKNLSNVGSEYVTFEKLLSAQFEPANEDVIVITEDLKETGWRGDKERAVLSDDHESDKVLVCASNAQSSQSLSATSVSDAVHCENMDSAVIDGEDERENDIELSDTAASVRRESDIDDAGESETAAGESDTAVGESDIAAGDCDAAACEVIGSDPPVYEEIDSDLAVIDSDPAVIDSDTVECEMIDSDPAVCEMIDSDTAVSEMIGSDPAVREVLESNAKTTLKRPRSGSDDDVIMLSSDEEHHPSKVMRRESTDVVFVKEEPCDPERFMSQSGESIEDPILCDDSDGSEILDEDVAEDDATPSDDKDVHNFRHVSEADSYSRKIDEDGGTCPEDPDAEQADEDDVAKDDTIPSEDEDMCLLLDPSVSSEAEEMHESAEEANEINILKCQETENEDESATKEGEKLSEGSSAALKDLADDAVKDGKAEEEIQAMAVEDDDPNNQPTMANLQSLDMFSEATSSQEESEEESQQSEEELVGGKSPSPVPEGHVSLSAEQDGEKALAAEPYEDSEVGATRDSSSKEEPVDVPDSENDSPSEAEIAGNTAESLELSGECGPVADEPLVKEDAPQVEEPVNRASELPIDVGEDAEPLESMEAEEDAGASDDRSHLELDPSQACRKSQSQSSESDKLLLEDDSSKVLATPEDISAVKDVKSSKQDNFQEMSSPDEPTPDCDEPTSANLADCDEPTSVLCSQQSAESHPVTCDRSIPDDMHSATSTEELGSQDVEDNSIKGTVKSGSHADDEDTADDANETAFEKTMGDDTVLLKNDARPEKDCVSETDSKVAGTVSNVGSEDELRNEDAMTGVHSTDVIVEAAETASAEVAAVDAERSERQKDELSESVPACSMPEGLSAKPVPEDNSACAAEIASGSDTNTTGPQQHTSESDLAVGQLLDTQDTPKVAEPIEDATDVTVDVSKNQAALEAESTADKEAQVDDAASDDEGFHLEIEASQQCDNAPSVSSESDDLHQSGDEDGSEALVTFTERFSSRDDEESSAKGPVESCDDAEDDTFVDANETVDKPTSDNLAEQDGEKHEDSEVGAMQDSSSAQGPGDVPDSKNDSPSEAEIAGNTAESELLSGECEPVADEPLVTEDAPQVEEPVKDACELPIDVDEDSEPVESMEAEDDAGASDDEGFHLELEPSQACFESQSQSSESDEINQLEDTLIVRQDVKSSEHDNLKEMSFPDNGEVEDVEHADVEELSPDCDEHRSANPKLLDMFSETLSSQKSVESHPVTCDCSIPDDVHSATSTEGFSSQDVDDNSIERTVESHSYADEQDTAADANETAFGKTMGDDTVILRNDAGPEKDCVSETHSKVAGTVCNVGSEDELRNGDNTTNVTVEAADTASAEVAAVDAGLSERQKDELCASVPASSMPEGLSAEPVVDVPEDNDSCAAEIASGSDTNTTGPRQHTSESDLAVGQLLDIQDTPKVAEPIEDATDVAADVSDNQVALEAESTADKEVDDAEPLEAMDTEDASASDDEGFHLEIEASQQCDDALSVSSESEELHHSEDEDASEALVTFTERFSSRDDEESSAKGPVESRDDAEDDTLVDANETVVDKPTSDNSDISRDDAGPGKDSVTETYVEGETGVEEETVKDEDATPGVHPADVTIQAADAVLMKSELGPEDTCDAEAAADRDEMACDDAATGVRPIDVAVETADLASTDVDVHDNEDSGKSEEELVGGKSPSSMPEGHVSLSAESHEDSEVGAVRDSSSAQGLVDVPDSNNDSLSEAEIAGNTVESEQLSGESEPVADEPLVTEDAQQVEEPVKDACELPIDVDEDAEPVESMEAEDDADASDDEGFHLELEPSQACHESQSQTSESDQLNQLEDDDVSEVLATSKDTSTIKEDVKSSKDDNFQEMSFPDRQVEDVEHTGVEHTDVEELLPNCDEHRSANPMSLDMFSEALSSQESAESCPVTCDRSIPDDMHSATSTEGFSSQDVEDISIKGTVESHSHADDEDTASDANETAFEKTMGDDTVIVRNDALPEKDCVSETDSKVAGTVSNVGSEDELRNEDATTGVYTTDVIVEAAFTASAEVAAVDVERSERQKDELSESVPVSSMPEGLSAKPIKDGEAGSRTDSSSVQGPVDVDVPEDNDSCAAEIASDSDTNTTGPQQHTSESDLAVGQLLDTQDTPKVAERIVDATDVTADVSENQVALEAESTADKEAEVDDAEPLKAMDTEDASASDDEGFHLEIEASQQCDDAPSVSSEKEELHQSENEDASEALVTFTERFSSRDDEDSSAKGPDESPDDAEDGTFVDADETVVDQPTSDNSEISRNDAGPGKDSVARTDVVTETGAEEESGKDEDATPGVYPADVTIKTANAGTEIATAADYDDTVSLDSCDIPSDDTISLKSNGSPKDKGDGTSLEMPEDNSADKTVESSGAKKEPSPIAASPSATQRDVNSSHESLSPVVPVTYKAQPSESVSLIGSEALFSESESAHPDFDQTIEAEGDKENLSQSSDHQFSDADDDDFIIPTSQPVIQSYGRRQSSLGGVGLGRGSRMSGRGVVNARQPFTSSPRNVTPTSSRNREKRRYSSDEDSLPSEAFKKPKVESGNKTIVASPIVRSGRSQIDASSRSRRPGKRPPDESCESLAKRSNIGEDVSSNSSEESAQKDTRAVTNHQKVGFFELVESVNPVPEDASGSCKGQVQEEKSMPDLDVSSNQVQDMIPEKSDSNSSAESPDCGTASGSCTKDVPSEVNSETPSLESGVRSSTYVIEAAEVTETAECESKEEGAKDTKELEGNASEMQVDRCVEDEGGAQSDDGSTAVSNLPEVCPLSSEKDQPTSKQPINWEIDACGKSVARDDTDCNVCQDQEMQERSSNETLPTDKGRLDAFCETSDGVSSEENPSSDNRCDQGKPTEERELHAGVESAPLFSESLASQAETEELQTSLPMDDDCDREESEKEKTEDSEELHCSLPSEVDYHSDIDQDCNDLEPRNDLEKVNDRAYSQGPPSSKESCHEDSTSRDGIADGDANNNERCKKGHSVVFDVKSNDMEDVTYYDCGEDDQISGDSTVSLNLNDTVYYDTHHSESRDKDKLNPGQVEDEMSPGPTQPFTARGDDGRHGGSDAVVKKEPVSVDYQPTSIFGGSQEDPIVLDDSDESDTEDHNDDDVPEDMPSQLFTQQSEEDIFSQDYGANQDLMSPVIPDYSKGLRQQHFISSTPLESAAGTRDDASGSTVDMESEDQSANVESFNETMFDDDEDKFSAPSKSKRLRTDDDSDDYEQLPEFSRKKSRAQSRRDIVKGRRSRDLPKVCASDESDAEIDDFGSPEFLSQRRPAKQQSKLDSCDEDSPPASPNSEMPATSPVFKRSSPRGLSENSQRELSDSFVRQPIEIKPISSMLEDRRSKLRRRVSEDIPSTCPTTNEHGEEEAFFSSQPVTKKRKVAAALQRLSDKYGRAERTRNTESPSSHSVEEDNIRGSQETPSQLPPAGQTRRQILANRPALIVSQTLRRIEELLSNLEDGLTDPRFCANERVAEWRKEIANVSKNLTLPRTVIAVVGDTGAGKSSLMNALLDHANIIPTSGIRACTAVVVDIAISATQYYEADIEFLSRHEWQEELDILVKMMVNKEGKIVAREPDPDKQPDAAAAWAKVKAVYGSAFKAGVAMDTFRRENAITRYLGRTKTIADKKPETFRVQVNKYIESTSKMECQWWPIVKKVSLRIPNCDVCNSGATLVDLPGIRDSNAARDRIAKEHLKNCNAVWVVANISRAVDNKTARDLLGTHFRRQLLMDGQYGAVSFVCTKTDDLMSSELIRNLEIDDKTLRYDKKIKELKDTLKDVHSALEEKTTEEEAMKSSVSYYLQDMKEDEEILDGLLDEDEIDSEVSLEIGRLQNLIHDKQESLKQRNDNLEMLDSVIKDLKHRVFEINGSIRKLQKLKSAVCAKERNAFAVKEIRQDFTAGLREMYRRARGVASDDEESDDEDDEREAERRGQQLKVFCVSAADYLKVTGILDSDGESVVFQDKEETGIPAIRRFVHEMTREHQEKSAKKMVAVAHQLIAAVHTYLRDQGTEDNRIRETVKNHILKRFAESEEDIKDRCISHVDADIDALYNLSLRPKVAQGQGEAVDKAPATVTKWGRPVNKERREQGGLHWSTYKAVVRHHGDYKSAAAGQINFNEDLASPAYDRISVVWNQVFNNQIGEVFASFVRRVTRAVCAFADALVSELVQLGIPQKRSQPLRSQVALTTTTKLNQSVEEVLNFVRNQQRDINRLITNVVQVEMIPAYVTCAADSGSGQFQRMKNVLASHVEVKRMVMFDKASLDLLGNLDQLKTQLLNGLKLIISELMKAIQVLYEPLWTCPTNNRDIQDTVLPSIARVLRQSKLLALEVGVDLSQRSSVSSQVSTNDVQDDEPRPGTSRSSDDENMAGEYRNTSPMSFQSGAARSDTRSNAASPSVSSVVSSTYMRSSSPEYDLVMNDEIKDELESSKEALKSIKKLKSETDTPFAEASARLNELVGLKREKENYGSEQRGSVSVSQPSQIPRRLHQVQRNFPKVSCTSLPGIPSPIPVSQPLQQRPQPTSRVSGGAPTNTDCKPLVLRQSQPGSDEYTVQNHVVVSSIQGQRFVTCQGRPRQILQLPADATSQQNATNPPGSPRRQQSNVRSGSHTASSQQGVRMRSILDRDRPKSMSAQQQTQTRFSKQIALRVDRSGSNVVSRRLQGEGHSHPQVQLQGRGRARGRGSRSYDLNVGTMDHLKTMTGPLIQRVVEKTLQQPKKN